MIKEKVLCDFTAGLLSGKWKGRYDTELYSKGLQALNNFVPFFPGGATLRPGTWYIGEIGAGAVRLIPFQISYSLTYILELSANKIRVWKNGALLMDDEEPLIPYSITTTFATPANVRYAQDGATLYMVDGANEIKTLAMNTIDEFIFGSASITYNVGYQPFNGAGNYPKAIAIFDGRLWLASTTNEPQTIWASVPFEYTNFTYFDTIESESEQFRDPANAFTGTIASGSNRITGIAADEIAKMKEGDMIRGTGIPYTYPTLYTYISAIGATYIDLTQNATATGTYSLTNGWHDPLQPETELVTITRDVITAAHGFKKALASEKNGEILWLSPGKVLTIGTLTNERVIPSGVNASEFKCEKVTDYGSYGIQPLTAADRTLFVSPDRKSIRHFMYSADSEGWDAPKFNRIADAVFTGLIREADYQSHDTPIMWFVLEDGTLTGCVYDPEVELRSFFTASVSGLVESIAVVPESGVDTVYLAVNRSGTRILVKMDALFSSMHLDDAVEKTAVARDVTGVSHIVGAATLVYSNVSYTVTITAGATTLPTGVPNGAKAVIGRAFTGTIKTMPIAPGPNMRMVPKISVRVQASYPFEAGQESNEETAKITGPYTGDVFIPTSSKWNQDGAVVITQDAPLDTTILALLAWVDVGG